MSGMAENLRGYLELTAAMVLVSSSVVVGKLMAESLPVFLAGGLNSSVGAAILVLALLRREGGLPTVSGRDLLILLLQALTGIFLFRVFLLWGLLFTTAAEDGVVTPAVVGLIALFFLKEKLGLRVVIGIALSVLGVLALNAMVRTSGPCGGPLHWSGICSSSGR